MRCNIEASRIAGRVAAPPSKSYTIRALAAAALAGGKSLISNPLDSDDTLAAIEAFRNLGALIRTEDGSLSINGGRLSPSNKPLDCRDSAATLRFVTAICATIAGNSVLEMGASLEQRPVKPLLEILNKMGAGYTCRDNRIVICGGSLQGGLYNITGDLSSQFVSALLLIAPLTGEDIAYQWGTPPRSRPYIEMTIEIMRSFGVQVNSSPDYTLFKTSPQSYHPASVSIEGDWSSASYLLAAGALAGEVTVEGLNLLSLQGDKAMISILQKMGVAILPDSTSITVRASRIHPITFDMSQCIDLLPTVAVCLATADGTSCLTGIARARLKESNRIRAVCEGLNRVGIQTEEQQDILTIHGGEPNSAVINSFNDHRIAMAFTVLGLAAGKMTITGAECISKTFPAFFNTMKSLGGNIEIEYG